MRAVELDVRQVHSLVVNKTWQKKRIEQEEIGRSMRGGG